MAGVGSGRPGRYAELGLRMAWPNKLEFIRSDLNTTELWVLKERMNDVNNYTIVRANSFAEFSEFIVRFNDTNEQYKFTETIELIDSVVKI